MLRRTLHDIVLRQSEAQGTFAAAGALIVILRLTRVRSCGSIPESGPALRLFIHCSYARWLNEALWITDSDSYTSTQMDFVSQKASTARWYGFGESGGCERAGRPILLLSPSEGACVAMPGAIWVPYGGETWATVIGALATIGLATRLFAYLLLVTTHRDKQI